MNEDLKKRWKETCSKIKKSGLKKEHIRTQVKIGKTAMACYTQVFRGKPKYPAYVTENTIIKIEKFFNPSNER